MTLHTNVITRLAVLLLLLGVVMAIGTPQVSAHHGPDHQGSTFIEFNTYTPLITALLALKGLQPHQQQLTFNWVRDNYSGHLDLSNTGINSVVGLEAFVNVTSMDLSGNNITNFNSFSGLTAGLTTNLKRLDLGGNSMTDISGLAPLTALTHLNLVGNNLTDTVTLDPGPDGRKGTADDQRSVPTAANAVLKPLENLTNLEELKLSYNNIAVIDALKELASLTLLTLNGNNIADFSPLTTNAVVHNGLGDGDVVWLGGNPFGDTFFNPANYNITPDSARLIGRGVTLYGSMGKIVGIPDAGLRNILIENLSPIVLARNLKIMLDPDNPDPATETEPYWVDLLVAAAAANTPPVVPWAEADLPEGRLYGLEISNVPSIEARVLLEPLTDSVLGLLRELNLDSEVTQWGIDDLRGIQHCKNLEILHLPRQYITQGLAPLKNLTKLKALDLSESRWEDGSTFTSDDIEVLKSLKDLRRLNLASNSLTAISPLDKMTQLEFLDLSDNLIKDFRGLEKLTNLRVLYLSTQWNVRDRWDAVAETLRAFHFGDYEALRALTHNITEHRLVTDTLIVKSAELAEVPPAYAPGGHITIDVTFHDKVSAKPSGGLSEAPFTGVEGLPGRVVTFKPSATGEKPSLAFWFSDGIERTAEWTSATYDANKHSTTVTFDHFIQPHEGADEVVIEGVRLDVPYGAAVVLWRPRTPIIPDPRESLLTGRNFVPPDLAWEHTKVSPHQFLSDLPKRGAPIVKTSPTVALRRADGETGTVTDDFDVEITFSAPLDAPSAAALANHISFGDAAGVSIGSLTRPEEPTYYVPETWTLTVSVGGANGDVTVTLDPEGLKDVAIPGHPVATAGSTLSVTVPVSSPPQFTPKTEPYVFGEALEMSILFAEDGVTYEGDTPPYITIYLGERVQANERHAKWARAEDADSTLVTFAYEIGAGDVAQSVSIKSEAGVAVPRGATVVLGEERVVGTAPPPAESGVAPPPTQQPASGGGTAAPGGTQRTVISLGTPSARVTATEIPVQIAGIVWLPETPTERETPGASSVPRTPIVFNELGNGSGDTNDWLEFRNVTGSAVSLKDWTLSVVQDDKKEDTSLIAFPDVSVPANGLLLIVNTSPDKTPLARGANIESSGGKNGGSAQPYLVNAGLSLPDDGKFLLILRNAKDKLGKNEAFIDVAGGGGSDTDAFVRNQEGDYDTYVWPLQVGEAPGGNTEEALGSGKVWQRAKADIVGYHKDAWAEAAFTGLGYDRSVTESAATAGTPGYPNGAVKTAAATPKGSVTFSEIMVDSGGGKLPQWIELYNNSKTEVLNLNRWELEIQNVDSEDLVGRPIVTLTLQEKLIQPNQTLLIVSGDARASSSARLPADRVYNLFELHEKNLRIKKPHDTFLSAEGFYLKLTDRNGATIDEVGNTDGNRRTNDAPYWALSMSREEGVRSSLIRRYTKGKSEAKDGMASGNWVLAANVKGFVADGEALHWGHAEDIGSPGYRKGGPLPVELSSFSVKRTEKGAVVLSWTTESEVDNAGFNLRRSEKRASGFTLINPALIAGAGTTGERQTYTFTDTSAKPGIEYYYQIEEVSFDGKSVPLVMRMLPGPVSALNRALTTFGELKRQRQE